MGCKSLLLLAAAALLTLLSCEKDPNDIHEKDSSDNLECNLNFNPPECILQKIKSGEGRDIKQVLSSTPLDTMETYYLILSDSSEIVVDHQCDTLCHLDYTLNPECTRKYHTEVYLILCKK